MSPETPRRVMRDLFERLEDPERRDEAVDLFADEATIVRPGERFHGPNAARRYVDSGGARYRSIAKTVDRWIETDRDAVSIGTLRGVTSDGAAFDGVRYVDVGSVENGRIVRLEIWNDLLADGVF